MSGVESPSDPACGVGCEVVAASIPRGGADPTHNQLSGAVGGRASGAPISIDKASLRAVFRGGSFVDGCGIAAQSVPWRCLRLFAAGGLLLAALAKNSSRHTPRAYALARREAHAPRMGGGMRNDTARDAFRAQRQNFCDAMRDLVVSPAMGVSTLEPGVVWARE